jgi:hypothetical protein
LCVSQGPLQVSEARSKSRLSGVVAGFFRFRPRLKMVNSMSQKYQKYLQSETWRKKRSAMLSICPQCTHCRSTEKLVVHHVRYPKTWGEETLSDLQVLCSTCHDKLHGSTKHLSKPLGRKLRHLRKQNKASIARSGPVRYLSETEVEAYVSTLC